MAEAVGLDAVQLHGSAADAAAVRDALGDRGLPVLVIRAIPVPAGGVCVADLRKAVAASREGADLILFDTRVEGRWGGTGMTFPWGPVREAAGHSPFLVAGGIGPHNVREALDVSGAWGVDVSSGVEQSPGIKDDALMGPFRSRSRTPGRKPRTTGRNDELTTAHRFGPYGGRYVPETLVSALEELDAAYETVPRRPCLPRELHSLQTDYAGRPTPLFRADRLSERAGCRVYLKREDLAHTGAHKINNTLGQILLAVRMGKKRIIAETGAGQHGVATATVAALFGLECHVYMGEEDIRRQELNVFRMRLLGRRGGAGDLGQRHAQGRDQRGHPRLGGQRGGHALHHRFGGRSGPVPRHGARLPGGDRPGDARADAGKRGAAARRAGGLRGRRQQRHRDVPRVRGRPGRAAGGRGGRRPGARLGQARRLARPGAPRASCTARSPTCSRTKTARSRRPTPSRRAWTIPPWARSTPSSKTSGRVEYTSATDDEALAAFQTLSRLEGIIPALESAHAIAYLLRGGPRLRASDVVVVSLSGRGDKDVYSVADALGVKS